MIRALKHSLGLSAAVLLALTPLSSCGDLSNLNNPFNPKAELRIIDITGAGAEGDGANSFIGIRQSASQENGQAITLYTYIDPVVTLETIEGFPLVNFTSFNSKVKLADGTQLPVKKFSLNKGFPRPSGAGAAAGAAGGAGGVAIPVVNTTQVDIQFPILSSDTSIQETVYVGNNAPRVTQGTADVELFGKDENGHEIVVPFTVPLNFSSTLYDASGSIPVLTPSASPDPAASPSPNSSNNN
jgi:hypothetical protein